MSKLKSGAKSKLQSLEHVSLRSGFQRTVGKRKKSGDDGAVDTPVPIPNTEVKHRSGEGISSERE